MTMTRTRVPPLWKEKEKAAPEAERSSRGLTETHAMAAKAKAVKVDVNHPEEKAEVVVTVEEVAPNSMGMAAIITQALALAEEEAVGGTGATLGDKEVTLRAIKPVTPIKSKHEPPPSSRSPTSQFEYDIMDAIHPTLDFDSLNKSYSDTLKVVENNSISSEESLQERNDEESIATDGLSTDIKADEDELVVDKVIETVMARTDCLADFMFCQLQCTFPNAVDEANEFMSNNLHNLFFEGDGKEESGEEVGALIRPLDEEVEAYEGVSCHIFGSCRQAAPVATVDEPNEDEETNLKIKNVMYSPGAGIVRNVVPKLSDDKVLINVDATTISARDCLERLRRDSNKELKYKVWVPGHEIVGHVVRAGLNAEFLLDKRIVALLPYGGGCSQYVCIDAKDVIVLPEEADSSDSEVVALLSTYMPAYQCLESVGIELEEEREEEKEFEPEEEEDDGSPEYAGQKKSLLLGKNVLIVGAGSPVGLALVDLSRNAGATVYTVSHIAHLSAIREMGANYWYQFTQKEVWEEEWRGKMDLIVDTVADSENNPSFFKVKKTRGRLVRLDITSCGQKYVPRRPNASIQEEHGLMKTLFDSYKERVINDKAIKYDIFHSFNDDKELFTEDLAYLLRLLQIGKIRPRIFSRVSFNELEGKWVEGEWQKVMSAKANGVVLVLPGRMV